MYIAYTKFTKNVHNPEMYYEAHVGWKIKGVEGDRKKIPAVPED